MHFLAARAEVANGRGQLFHLRDAAAGHAAEIEHEHFDALVFLRRLDGVDQIAQQRFSALPWPYASAMARSNGSPASCSTSAPCGASTSAALCGTIGMLRRQRRSDEPKNNTSSTMRCSTLRSASSAAPEEAEEGRRWISWTAYQVAK